MEPTKPKINEQWYQLLKNEFEAPYFTQLKTFLVEEKHKHVIYPPGPQIFAAFDHTPPDRVKVVIMGQDPYHGPGQAHGLCFSVPDGIAPPPSLVNIFKEIRADLNIPISRSGNLTRWADQGVFLLNATLTVRSNQAGSHQKKGWEIFTDSVIKTLSQQYSGIVFLLWGNYAKAKESLIDTSKHTLLKAAHPSPLSAYNGFFGCKHFSETNKILESIGKQPVDWSV